MKILFLPTYCKPEKAASGYLGQNRNEAYSKRGWEMLVFAPTPCRGISEDERKEYKKKKHRVEKDFNGYRTIYRFPMFAEGKNPILRAIRFFLISLKQFNRVVFSGKAKGANVMFLATTPPYQGLVGAAIKKVCNIPFVYNLQDIFPDSLVGTGLAKKGGLLWRIGRRIEDIGYRNADKIIVISEDFKKNILAKGVPEEKIEVIYNWVDEKAVVPVEKEANPLYNEFDIDKEKFTLVYAGNLGNAQNLDIVLDAAPELLNVQFLIFGRKGGKEEEIKERIKRDRLTNVKLFPLQPPERAGFVYSLGDVCLVSCKSGLGGSAMPSKTWSIMSCARPVIAHFDEGELKEIIENNDCGVFTHAGNVQEFIDAVKGLSCNPSRCKEMGANARGFILNNLTREVGTQKYVDVLKAFEK